MATLYVTEPGARLEKEYQRILVVKDSTTVFSTPLAGVSQVVMVGRCGATTPALLALLDHGIGLTFISASGRMRGRLVPPTGKDAQTRAQQAAASMDEVFCLKLARAIVIGKIRNSIIMAQRMLRSMADRNLLSENNTNLLQGISQLWEIAQKCAGDANEDQLRGHEGQAARVYFSILAAALKWGADSFETRSRRPARNPVNALLNLCYSLLLNHVMTAIEIAGLDPYIGFFHAQKYGRPGLALDLMEEFRPVVADAVVMAVINKGIVRECDFLAFGGQRGLILKRNSVKRLIRFFNKKVDSAAFCAAADRPLSFRKIFEVQANLIKKQILGSDGNYNPFTAR